MKSLFSVLAVFLSITVPLGFNQDIPHILSSSPVLAQADSTWPMFHHDMHHTGLSPLRGDMNTCYLLWSYTTGGYVGSSPALGDIDGDGKLEVVIGSHDDRVYALNGEDGSFLWSYTTASDWVYSSPALGDIDGDGNLEVVVGVGPWSCRVYALNGEDGSFLWSYTTGNYIYTSSPALGDIDGDDTLEVVIGSFDNSVYALNGEDGTLFWSYATGGPAPVFTGAWRHRWRRYP